MAVSKVSYLANTVVQFAVAHLLNEWLSINITASIVYFGCILQTLSLHITHVYDTHFHSVPNKNLLNYLQGSENEIKEAMQSFHIQLQFKGNELLNS